MYSCKLVRCIFQELILWIKTCIYYSILWYIYREEKQFVIIRSAFNPFTHAVAAVYNEDLVDSWGTGFAVNVNFRILHKPLFQFLGSK